MEATFGIGAQAAQQIGFLDNFHILASAIFKFKHFDLVFDGQRKLSEEQMKKREKAIASGIDGGDSMLQPSNAFSIFQGNRKIAEFELGILPYSRQRIEIDGHKFELKNNTIDGHWVLNILK